MSLSCRELLDHHPAVLEDRHRLSFTRETGPGTIVEALSRHGVVMLRQALPVEMLEPCRDAFHNFSRSLGRPRRWRWGDEGPDPRWDAGESELGSWHMPWVVRHRGRRPAATVITALLKSWAWPIIETLCDSREIAILLGYCVARHNIDAALGVGAHQDATVVSDRLPFSIWVPLHDVTPGRTSGLGFVVPAPTSVLAAQRNGDVGPTYILQNLPNIWLPAYCAGDITIHSKMSPHFTTGFGTGTDRYSLEIRAAPSSQASPEEMDPGLFVDQATIVGTQRLPHRRTSEFLAALQAQA
jgi:hypothetical protein